MKVAFIQNSTRTLNERAVQTIALAKADESLDCYFAKTAYSKHATELAEEFANQGFEAIVAIGGDGTCNEIVNGIQNSEGKGEILFGIVPNGSGNDFQKMLGEFEAGKFIHALKSKSYKQIDLCKIEMNNKIAYSLNIAGIGFDGKVVQTLEKIRRKIGLRGQFAYGLAILSSFANYKKPVVEISAKDFHYRGKLLLMAVCNGAAFGHGLYINPTAKIDDGLLNITLLGEVSFWDYVKNISKVKKGALLDHPGVQYFQTPQIRIVVNNQTIFTELDGENCGSGDVSFMIEKQALKLIC